MVLLIAILGLGIMTFGVGRAALLRSDAQTAADAAALAGVRNIRQQLVNQLTSTGTSSLAAVDRGLVEAAARDYAKRNGDARVRKLEIIGGDVRVEVDSQKVGDLGRSSGTDDSRAEARARARLYLTVSPGLGGSPTGGGGVGGTSGGDTTIDDAEWKDFAKTVKGPPKCSAAKADNDVTRLGEFLRGHNILAGENAQLGDNPAPGVHSATGWHYQCGNSGAIDVNVVPPGREGAVLDAIRPKIEAMGYFVIWREEGHFDHMHVQPASGTPSSGGGAPGGFGAAGSLEDTQLEIKLVDWDAPAPLGFAGNFLGSANGNPFGPPDPRVAKKACEILDRYDVHGRARLALWEAMIVESGVHDLSFGDATSVGVLQLLSMHGSVEKRRDLDYAIGRFLNRGFAQPLGAIALARRHPDWSPGKIAQTVQGSAYPERYDQRASQGAALDGAFCG
jgi:Putative Flp pilus-assembly TadE/G-like